jgi:hypothetical protein
MLTGIASRLDALGVRPFVAKVANLAYSGHSFSVDRDGHWVMNQQPECTIVSPVPHTLLLHLRHHSTVERGSSLKVPRLLARKRRLSNHSGH